MKRPLRMLFIIAIITMMGVTDGETADDGRGLIDTATGMEFVFVKGGCFQMGDTFGDGRADEKPVHEVCVNDFYIGKYEVTQGQWQKVMDNNPSYFNNRSWRTSKRCDDNCPVESVSWDDIQKFINKLNSQTSKNYRLPTEAEWEYAARSGGKKEKWSGTNNESSLVDYVWYNANTGKTNPVGQKKPNGLGIYDMTGNVWEWCSDWYGEKYYKESPRDNPKGSSTTTERVVRGGSWYDFDWDMHASKRSWLMPSRTNNTYGFRLLAPRGQ